ncbi:MAG TPA: hypothetical protein VMH00_14200 [Candidatus Limnocylindrales bacterium]|nr:hypothetical protein [Candidatus Limnocylindrales bacterium]
MKGTGTSGPRIVAAKDLGRWAGRVCVVVLALCASLIACTGARADVGIVLNESLDTSVARITGSGHSAVYFSRICPETPIKLRLCRPGEEGSVVSNYTTLGEDQPYEWNVVPLSIYLHGVENPANRPVFGSPKLKYALEERYREKYLSDYCTTNSCKTSNSAEWREMVAATISRSLYIFVVKTTAEQDRALIAEFNASPNENHFNGVTRNCATFTRSVMNFYFPDSTKADYLNDFGMTSPKAIARSFTRYALKHPDSDFHILHFAQVPGTYKRSSECRDGTEQLYHSKKLLVPMAIFAYHALPVVAASYLITGRFNPEHEWEKYPTAEATETRQLLDRARHDTNEARVEMLETDARSERLEMTGSKKEWGQYRKAFDVRADEAVSDEVISSRDSLKRLFKRVDDGEVVLDANGSAWAEIKDEGETRKVGLSADNVLAPFSDAQLAYQLVLARIGDELKSPKHARETMVEFRQDWDLLSDARLNHSTSVTASADSPSSSRWSAKPAGEGDN